MLHTLNMELTGPSNILEKLFGFQTSQVLFVAVELGIFDDIETSDNTTCTAKNVSKRLGLDAEATERILKTCVALDFVKLEEQNGQECYSNTVPTSRYLVSASPESLAGMVRRMPSQYEEFQKLSNVIKLGQHNVISSDIAHEGQISGEKFEYNVSMMRLAAPSLVTAFNLEQFRSHCDLAGGVGVLAQCLTQTYPGMKVKVMEQAGVVDYAKAKGYHLDNQGREVIEFIKGDMMVSDLPAVDVFTMAHVCMYYKDEDLVRLFKRIHRSLPTDGALILYESLLNEKKTGPLMTTHRDLAELVVATYGERNEREYRTLLKRAGFSNVMTKIFKAHICYDVIYATKDGDALCNSQSV